MAVMEHTRARPIGALDTESWRHMTLCGVCASDVAKSYVIDRGGDELTRKGVCDMCHRRRYCAPYKVLYKRTRPG